MKILLIEDEEKTVQSLKKGIEEQGIQVEYALDGLSGMLIAQHCPFDVIVSDIVMPQLSGLELVRQLRHQGNRTPILLLTALGETDDLVRGLDAGADDYLAKPFEFQVLLARIRALARRHPDAIPYQQVLHFADVVINLDAHSCHRAGKKIELTPKEFDLMVYFIQNRGRVISKKEIAENVWDIHFDTGTNVIEVYVNYLRNKIDRPFEQKIIHTVFGFGYVLKTND